ncbi:MAG: glutathione S-transferase family protein [Pseudomonadota bacterium]
MSEKLTLYTNPMSRGRIARWMLEETGVPYEVEILGYGTSMKAPEYLAINPMGKVPAITHGDHVVTECAAICTYLADAFPEAGLAPPLSQRAAYYRWLFFGAGPVEAAVTAHAMGLEAPADKAATAGYGTYENVMDVLEGVLSRNAHVAGAGFSAADVYVGAQIVWGLGFKTIDPRPAFIDYAARMKERPAYQRADALDNAAGAEAEI